MREEECRAGFVCGFLRMFMRISAESIVPISIINVLRGNSRALGAHEIQFMMVARISVS